MKNYEKAVYNYLVDTAGIRPSDLSCAGARYSIKIIAKEIEKDSLYRVKDSLFWDMSEKENITPKAMQTSIKRFVDDYCKRYHETEKYQNLFGNEERVTITKFLCTAYTVLKYKR